jgi:hypothetical protein
MGIARRPASAKQYGWQVIGQGPPNFLLRQIYVIARPPSCNTRVRSAGYSFDVEDYKLRPCVAPFGPHFVRYILQECHASYLAMTNLLENSAFSA